MVPLDVAYGRAKDRADNPDAALAARKHVIRERMGHVASQIAAVKRQAQQAQDDITAIVENALKDLYEIVEQKTSTLKADRVELARQYKEIEFMTEYLKA